MVETRGPVTFGVTLALIIVATVFVAARFFTRAFIVRSIRQDDWWILAAWICSVGFSVAICVAVSEGLGKHIGDIAEYDKDDLRRAQYAFSILYNPCLMLTKTSIIVFYLSVMSEDVDPVFKWCNWLTLAIVNVAGLALTFLNIFQCRPIPAGWSWPPQATDKCTDIVTLYLSSAPVNIITDLALLFLPMPILTGLRLPKKQKIILVVTFSAGAFVAIVDVVRIAYLQDAALDRLMPNNDPNSSSSQRIVQSTDFTWYASLSFMWSAIEVDIGLICACVPSLKPLFLKFAPNLIKDSTDDNSPMGSFDAGEKPNMALSTADADGSVLTNPAAFRRPTVREYAGDDDGDYMGFLNMLSGPDDDAPGANSTQSKPSRKSTTVSTKSLSRTTSANSTASDFGFVKMDRNKNMLKLNNRQSLWAVAVVTVIFFLWGFARGLLDVLNAQFQSITNLSNGETLGLHGVYYAGYFVGPLSLGRFMLHRYGFKSTMMAGLCIYGSGTLVFWPAAVLTSYPAFLVSNFIVGFGLSLLEVAANPYIALCGPLEYAEVRLNFSQAFQAIGQICSPLLARRVLFKNILDPGSLVNVQWAYLGISLFDFALAIAFYYIPLPEANAEQLEEQADKRSAVYRTRVGRLRIVWVTAIIGVFSQFCYVGAQEGSGGNAGPMVESLRSPGMPPTSDFNVLNATTFAVGRFLGSFLNYLVKPRWILLACFTGVIAITASQLHAEGGGGIAAVNLSYLFEGSIFPIIFAICMRGMGDQTFDAAALMTASISSGALIPPIVWAVQNAHGLRYSYSVMLGVLCFGAIFPIYLNLMPAAKKQVDPIHESRDRRRTRRRALRAQRSNSATSNGSNVSEIPEKQFGIRGILARKKKEHEKHVSGVSFMPQSEHVERSMSDITDAAISPKQSVNPWNEKAWDDLSMPEVAHIPTAGSNVATLSSWSSTQEPKQAEKTEKPKKENGTVTKQNRPALTKTDSWDFDEHDFSGKGAKDKKSQKEDGTITKQSRPALTKTDSWDFDEHDYSGKGPKHKESQKDSPAVTKTDSRNFNEHDYSGKDSKDKKSQTEDGTITKQSRPALTKTDSWDFDEHDFSGKNSKDKKSREDSPVSEQDFMQGDQALMSGGSGESLGPGAGRNSRTIDEDDLVQVASQETREWTEEDDIRDDYHKMLRGM